MYKAECMYVSLNSQSYWAARAAPVHTGSDGSAPHPPQARPPPSAHPLALKQEGRFML